MSETDVDPHVPAHFVLSIEEMADLTVGAIRHSIERTSGNCIVDMPMPSIGTANSPVSIASDYGDALFVGEKLNSFCTSLEAEMIPVDRYYGAMRFTGSVRDAKSFAETLIWLSNGLDPENEDDTANEVRNQIADLINDLPFRKVVFPDLADCYMMNEIIGQDADNICDDDPEVWNQFFPGLPEARFHFIRSAIGHLVGGTVFMSPDVWVVESKIPIPDLLRSFGGLTPNDLRLKEAVVVSSEDGMGLFSDGQFAVRVRITRVEEAISMLTECGYAVGKPLDSFAILSTGTNFIARSENWTVVLFPDDVHVLPAAAIEGLLGGAQKNIDLLRSCLGRPVRIQCPWETLSDDQFELLCCDVLTATGVFDYSSLKKMGKSRSRDGGRDFEIRTRARAGASSVTWIYQCKATSRNSALSGSRVSISDVIDQYGCQGFGVMTCGLMDATLWDKLKSICERRRVGHDAWDRLRLERFLIEHREIRERYFGF